MVKARQRRFKKKDSIGTQRQFPKDLGAHQRLYSGLQKSPGRQFLMDIKVQWKTFCQHWRSLLSPSNDDMKAPKNLGKEDRQSLFSPSGDDMKAAKKIGEACSRSQMMIWKREEDKVERTCGVVVSTPRPALSSPAAAGTAPEANSPRLFSSSPSVLYREIGTKQVNHFI